jgi:hypothetical protein
VVEARAAAEYLGAYVRAYRAEHDRLVAPPPEGAALPRVVDSPYLDSPTILCLLANDGAAIADLTREPSYAWHVAGGPALLVDLPDPNSRITDEWHDTIEAAGLTGKNIGISRVTFSGDVPDDVWEGRIPSPVEAHTVKADATTIEVNRLDIEWLTLIERLTFGAYGRILDIHLPKDAEAAFWQPVIVRDLGFVTADRVKRRFFRQLEFVRHVDPAAWDLRTVWARAKLDVRRDMSHTVGMAGRAGATMALAGSPQLVDELFVSRLAQLDRSIAEFEALLAGPADVNESVVHEFLYKHPLLVDIYGEVHSRPRFTYPEGASPMGKRYVEPDFVVRRPLNRYRVIELERPSKMMATRSGQARAEVGQAAFQIGEFRDFILEHYEMLREQFPGINRDAEMVVVISRSRQESFGGRADVSRHMQLLREQFKGIDLVTHDDLLTQARAARDRLTGVAIEWPRPDPVDHPGNTEA